METLLPAGISLGGLAAALVAYASSSAPALERPTLGSRGQRRTAALAEIPWFGVAEPLLRWLGARVSPALGDRARAALDLRLVLAGEPLGLLADEALGLHLASAVIGAAATALHAHAAGALRLPHLAWLAVGLIVPYLALSGRIDRRREALVRGLPYVADLLALGMTAGLDFPGAVRHVVERSSDREDPLTSELERLLQALSVGNTRKEALSELVARTQVASVQELAQGIVQAEERGTPLVDALMVQATVARMKRSAAAEEAAARASVALYLPLTLLLGTVMILLMTPLVLKILSQMNR